MIYFPNAEDGDRMYAINKDTYELKLIAPDENCNFITIVDECLYYETMTKSKGQNTGINLVKLCDLDGGLIADMFKLK